MFRRLRILVLLMILAFVALGTWLDRVQSTDWDGPLLVALYPVNADASAAAAEEIRNPQTADTGSLTGFFAGKPPSTGCSSNTRCALCSHRAVAETPPTARRRRRTRSAPCSGA